MSNKTLDRILVELVSSYIISKQSATYDEATAQIKELIESVIGEDEDEVVDYFEKNKARNQLRQEQRERLKSL